MGQEYTKGDWKWQWEGGQPTVRAHDPKDPLSLIATVYPKIGKRVFAPIDEAEANAQLIASAPDLYEALAYLNEHTDEKQYTPYARELCRKALAKAEGK